MTAKNSVMNDLLPILINTILFFALFTLFCGLTVKQGCGYSLILGIFLGMLQQIEKHLRPKEVTPVQVEEEPQKQVLHD